MIGGLRVGRGVSKRSEEQARFPGLREAIVPQPPVFWEARRTTPRPGETGVAIVDVE